MKFCQGVLKTLKNFSLMILNSGCFGRRLQPNSSAGWEKGVKFLGSSGRRRRRTEIPGRAAAVPALGASIASNSLVVSV